MIPFDWESTPLQVKTSSTAGSNVYISVAVHYPSGYQISIFYVRFEPTIKFYIYNCIEWGSDPVLPTQDSDGVDRIWTFTKTSTALIVSCNGVEMINYVFSEGSKSECASKWANDVGYVSFRDIDKASDYYRAKTGTFGPRNLIVNCREELEMLFVFSV